MFVLFTDGDPAEEWWGGTDGDWAGPDGGVAVRLLLPAAADSRLLLALLLSESGLPPDEE